MKQRARPGDHFQRAEMSFIRRITAAGKHGDGNPGYGDSGRDRAINGAAGGRRRVGIIHPHRIAVYFDNNLVRYLVVAEAVIIHTAFPHVTAIRQVGKITPDERFPVVVNALC